MEGIKFITDSAGNRESVIIDLSLYGEQIARLIDELRTADNLQPKIWVRSEEYVNNLLPVYQDYISKLWQSNSIKFEGVSSPLLMSIHEDYAKAKFKIMFVGKETNGGLLPKQMSENVPAAVNELIRAYELFDMAQNSVRKSMYRVAPFWRFIYSLAQKLNEHTEYRRDFVWTNLSKVDQYTNTPSRDILQELQSVDLGLLKKEVSILKPDVVVFLTGWGYNDYMKQYLGPLEYSSVRDIKKVYRVKIEGFPVLTYQTAAHPKPLSMQKQLKAVIDTISDDVLMGVYK